MSFENLGSEFMNLTLTDINGRILWQSSGNFRSGKQTLNLSEQFGVLDRGIYYLSLKDEKGAFVLPISKQ